MLTLYDNPFSPFTRKVRLVLAWKAIPYRSIDGLALDQIEALAGISPRAEVPVLVDGALTITESADIAAYLEDVEPTPSVYPDTPRQRAKAREWQRTADRVLDAIVHDASIWGWPTHSRSDRPPPGLLEAARRDLHQILGRLEGELDASGYVCERVSIADFALFPQLTALRSVGIELTPERYPGILRWNRRMRELAAVREDIARVRQGMSALAEGRSRYESKKIVWRGDRVEWLLANGYHAWLAAEFERGDAVAPRCVGLPPEGKS